MKHFATLALIVLASAAPAATHADEAPKRLVIGNTGGPVLQGWTRLNGSVPFESGTARDAQADATPAPAPDAATDRARRLALEAEYQKSKARAGDGW